MRKYLILLTLLTLASCGGRGQKKQAASTPGGEDNVSFFITARTPSDVEITDDAYIPTRGNSYNGGQWTEFTPDSRISQGWEPDMETIGLCERLELGKSWLCIKFPHHDENMTSPIIRTGTTISHSEDYVGDTFTVLEGVKDDFDIGFRELRADDFRHLEQEVVEARAEHKRINDRIGDAILNGKIDSYRNSGDTMRMRSLNRFSFGQRQLLVANYTSAGYDFVYLVEDDNIITFSSTNAYYCELHFFALNDDKVYMFNMEQLYAGIHTKIIQLDPGNADRDKIVFKYTKSGD